MKKLRIQPAPAVNQVWSCGSYEQWGKTHTRYFRVVALFEGLAHVQRCDSSGAVSRAKPRPRVTLVSFERFNGKAGNYAYAHDAVVPHAG